MSSETNVESGENEEMAEEKQKLELRGSRLERHGFPGNGLPGGEQQQESSSSAKQVQLAPAEQSERSLITEEESDSPTVIHVERFPMDENNHRYVGLINQAMTCYLNSLVQTLYMTPEFRNAMYEWEYSSSSKGTSSRKGESSIPCQLQKLFLLLQTTDNDVLETRDLTASFGWSSSEALDQHDVQELCRLMFDALEHKWKKTKHEKLIQDLYRGTMEDFVKCLVCGKENVKQDFFLDLPLAVKPFGASVAYRSVEEALRGFVQPELLEGSNQYYCEKCKKKQDAHKGLRITQFPYLLTIQLKRFDFDYNTMHRIKLNDRMTFPDILDLNAYVYTDNLNVKNGDEEVEEEEENDGNSSGISHSYVDAKRKSSSPEVQMRSNGTYVKNPYIFHDESTVRIGEPIDKQAVQALLKRGEYVYELFSVMVHSGSAAGGHYFAYIKNLEQDRWYIFNDSKVDFISIDDIERSFGGNAGGWSTSNTNAYMLMYRKVDKLRNKKFIHTDNLPSHIHSLQQKWIRQEKEAEEERKIQLSLIRVHVRLNYPLPSIVKLQNKKIIDVISHKHQILKDFEEYVTEISRNEPILAVYNQAFEYYTERAKFYSLTLTKNNSRLIYIENRQFVKTFVSKADMEKKPLKSLFNTAIEPASLTDFYFWLDVRVASEPFPIEPFGGYVIKVQRIDIGKKDTSNDLLVYVPEKDYLIKVKALIGAQFKDDAHAALTSRLVLESSTSARSEFILIGSDMKSMMFRNLIDLHVGMAFPTFYYDGGLDHMCSIESKEATINDRLVPFERSAMYQILDRQYFSISMRVRFPSTEEILKAVAASGIYKGPTWAETMGLAEHGEGREVEEDNTQSGRVSTASMRSISVDDFDVNEAGKVSDSFCNNTPEISPNVSENEEIDSVGISSIEKKNQFNIEKTIGYMNAQHYESIDNFSTTSLPGTSYSNKNFKAAFNVDDNASESQSAASSGQSTVVPSTSNAPCLNENMNSIDGKINVIYKEGTYQHLDVDGRLKMGDFKIWLANQMHLDKDQFVIVKHASAEENDLGYETNSTEDDVESQLSNTLVSVKLRPPLKFDERLIEIIQFDMLENNKENWKKLFHVVASTKTYVGDVLLHCIRMYKEVYGEELKVEQVRLLNMYDNGIRVLNLNEFWDSKLTAIYMQIITNEESIGKPGVPIFVRRFRPSTVEVSKIEEIVVNSKAENPLLELLETLSKHSKIPLDQIGLVEWKNAWLKWPYLYPLLDMLEERIQFTANINENCQSPNHLFARISTRVLYYKDMKEIPKVLSEDERKQIKIKDNGHVAIMTRRKERPLRIQMSSVSEA